MLSTLKYVIKNCPEYYVIFSLTSRKGKVIAPGNTYGRQAGAGSEDAGKGTQREECRWMHLRQWQELLE